MTDDERTALIHAELDGELDTEQRASLARLLLADPQVRALRDDLQGVCSHLDTIGQVEPPPQLKDSILNRLPPVSITTARRDGSFGRWRLAAMAAGLLTAGTIVFETVQEPTPASRETVGTIAADSQTTVDSVVLTDGPVAGIATLYRDKSGLAIRLEVSAVQPVDVLISMPGHSFRINGLGSSSPAGRTRRTIALSRVRMEGQDIELSFLIGERTVSRAMLHVPSGS